MQRNKYLLNIIMCSLWLLAGCTQAEPSYDFSCQVVLEQGEGFQADSEVCTLKQGQDATFQLQVKDGYTLTGTDYANYSLERQEDGIHTTLILHNVRYSTVVTVTAEQSGSAICYHANGGECLDKGVSTDLVSVAAMPSHLRINTSIGTDLFYRDGYTLIGWNTKADGSGTAVGLGSRIEWDENLTLYAQWAKWTDKSAFTYEMSGAGIVITGYSGTEETLVIPAQIDGKSVWSIGEKACEHANCKIIILPMGLKKVEAYAFRASALETLYLSDDIVNISDYAIADCKHFTTLHINAVEAPVYSGNYFDTFSDKFDRLLQLQDKKKIVLFSGSSARFGYDSALLDEAFPDYEIVNMGVFAYTNASPQLILILDCMQEGDILLHSPEFDAAQRQFCTKNTLEDAFFCMMESNYDLVARLDLSQFEQVFTALNSYLSTKADMKAKSYSLSASHFDEDGNAVDTPSYNEYGDYILYRPNADSEEPVYGLPVDYTVGAFSKEQFIEPINAMYERFLNKGVKVYFTYAPRNKFALSENSTPAARAELHQYFQENLIVPVISDLEESLYSGIYLYGTDNHLSTEGVQIRTQHIIADLKSQMTLDELEHNYE